MNLSVLQFAFEKIIIPIEDILLPPKYSYDYANEVIKLCGSLHSDISI
jgi:hypothetical protein